MAMSKTSVLLPDSILRAAEVQARLRGVSLEEWVTRALTERIDTEDGAREYFRRRAAGASPGALRRILDAVPDGPPMLGDEL